MISAVYVATSCNPVTEVLPDAERREWESVDAWLADPLCYWFPDPVDRA